MEGDDEKEHRQRGEGEVKAHGKVKRKKLKGERSEQVGPLPFHLLLRPFTFHRLGKVERTK
jgi:hypothetical protein